MEAGLIFAETVFYFVLSGAIIVICIFTAIIAYHLIHITLELEKLSRSIIHVGTVAGERINDIVNRLSGLPILSYFMKKRLVRHDRKSRENLLNK